MHDATLASHGLHDKAQLWIDFAVWRGAYFGIMKRGRLICIIGIVLFVACVSLVNAAPQIKLDDIKKVFPKAASFSHQLDPVDHYILQDSNGKGVGIAFITSDIPPEVRGYNGEIDVLVGMDPSGKITGVNILSHKENAEYMNMVISGGFLNKFVGRSLESGMDDIDAVTGATVSSTAIKQDIQTAAFVIFKDLTPRSNPVDLLPVAGVSVLLLGVIAAISMPRKRWLRYVVWPLSILVAGVWLNSPITIGNFVDIRNGILPSYLPLIILLAFALGAALIKGNFYCAYVCPFGSLQELAGRAKTPKCRPSETAHRNASWLKWIILLMTVFAIATSVDAFRSIEPFALFFSRTYQPIVWAQAGIILLGSLFVIRPWCKYFCPTGAVLGLICQISHKMRRHIRRRRVNEYE